MRANLPIYRQAMDFYKVEVVVPYEEYLIEFLSTHTDKSDIYEDNYLDALNSVHSIGRCHRFARYLALGLKGPFKLIEGNLSALNKVRFDHCWIETEDSVYDVSFSGKWPKETYYKLFKPTSQKVIDLDKDPTFARIKANMVAAKVPSKEPHLK